MKAICRFLSSVSVLLLLAIPLSAQPLTAQGSDPAELSLEQLEVEIVEMYSDAMGNAQSRVRAIAEAIRAEVATQVPQPGGVRHVCEIADARAIDEAHGRIMDALRTAHDIVENMGARETAMAKVAELVGELTEAQRESMFAAARARVAAFPVPERDLSTGLRPLSPEAQLIGLLVMPRGVTYYVASPGGMLGIHASATIPALAQGQLSLDFLPDGTILLGADSWSPEDREQARELARARAEATETLMAQGQGSPALLETLHLMTERARTVVESTRDVAAGSSDEGRAVLRGNLEAIVREMNETIMSLHAQIMIEAQARAARAQYTQMPPQPITPAQPRAVEFPVEHFTPNVRQLGNRTVTLQELEQAGEIVRTPAQPVMERSPEGVEILRTHSGIIGALRAADAARGLCAIGLGDLRETAMAKAAKLVSELTEAQRERMFEMARARANTFVPPQRDPNEIWRSGHVPLSPQAQLVGIDSTPDRVAYYLVSPDSESAMYSSVPLPTMMQASDPAAVRMREMNELANAHHAASTEEERAIVQGWMIEASRERQRAEFGIVPPWLPQPLIQQQLEQHANATARALATVPQYVPTPFSTVQPVQFPDGTTRMMQLQHSRVPAHAMPATPPSPERDHAYARLAEKYFVMMERLQQHVTILESQIAQIGAALQNAETCQWHSASQSANESVLLLQRQRLGRASVSFVDCFNKVSPQIRTGLILHLIDKAESIEGLRMLEALLEAICRLKSLFFGVFGISSVMEDFRVFLWSEAA